MRLSERDALSTHQYLLGNNDEHFRMPLFTLQEALPSKNVEENVFLVTVQRGKRTLEIKTMWKENRSGASC